MTRFLLADAFGDGAQIEIKASDIIYAIFLLVIVLFFVPILIWLTRRLRASQQNIKRSLDQNDELIKLLSRSCVHAELSERHLAAIEYKLDQVVEQLKRPPHS